MTDVNVEIAFPHERLDAYRLAVEFARDARRLAAQVPRGHRALADHLQRAGDAPALLIAEGANRRSAGEKRQRFDEARGETGEAVGVADVMAAHGFIAAHEFRSFRATGARIAAMLTGLMRHSR